MRHSLLLCGAAAVVAFTVLTAGSPAGAAPRVTMTPDRNLVDGQVTTVSGSGFPPYTNIELLECAGTSSAPPASALYCDGFAEDVTGYSNRWGDYINAPGRTDGTSGFRVTVLPTQRERGIVVRCDGGHPCVLYAGVDINDWQKPHVFIPINFAKNASAARAAGAGGGSTGWSTVLVVVVAAAVLVGAGVYSVRRGGVSRGRKAAAPAR